MPILKKKPGPPLGYGSITPDPMKAPPIAIKIDVARRDLADVVASLGSLSLAFEMNEEGAGERLNAAKRLRVELESRIADLEAAHEAARAIDQASIRKAQANAHAHHIKMVAKHLAERDRQAMALSNAIGHAVDAWRLMWVAGRKAQRSWPTGGGIFPTPNLIDDGGLTRAVFDEIYRQGGTHPLQPVDDLHAPTFAGLPPPGSIGAAPANRPVFTDEIARATNWVLRELEGKNPAKLSPDVKEPELLTNAEKVVASRAQYDARVPVNWVPRTDKEQFEWLAQHQGGDSDPVQPAERVVADIAAALTPEPVVEPAARPAPLPDEPLPPHIVAAKEILAHADEHSKEEVAKAMVDLSHPW